MPRELKVFSHLFPREGVQLGRLVTNIKAPHNGFYPDHKIRHLKGDVYSIQNNEFFDTRSKTIDSRFRVALDCILNTHISTERDTGVAVTNTICVTYFLDNSDAKFKNLCEKPAAKVWFETAYRKRKNVYMVTGIQTLTDASLSLQSHSSGEVAGNAALPTTAVLSSLPTADCNATLENLRQRYHETGFVAENEQIYAIEYRKVKFRLRKMLRRDYDPKEAMLEEGSRWEVMWRTMGNSSEELTEIEVSLEQDSQWEEENILESSYIDGQKVLFVFDETMESRLGN